MQKELEKLKRKDRTLITMLDGLTSASDTVGIHNLENLQYETRVVNVTPELAEKFLERNTANRNCNKVNVTILASEMLNKKWMFNGETVTFDHEGTLRNGQHRLKAIIESSESQPILIVTGVTPEAFTTMDIGSRRNGGDILSIKNVKNSKSASSLCKFVFAYKNTIYTETQHANRTLSNTKIYTYYKTLTDSESSIEFGGRLSKDKDVEPKVLSRNQLCGFHYLFSEKNKQHANEFLEGVFYGNNLDRDSPILAIRNRLLKARRNKNYKIPNKEFIMIMTIAWNKWRNNEKAKNITLPRKMDDFILELI
jgi:hypothetical protein